MNISPIYTKSLYSINQPISFCAKNKDTRKADNIMRTAANTFPMFKPTYADIFYAGLKNDREKEDIQGKDHDTNFSSRRRKTDFQFDSHEPHAGRV